MFVFVRGGWPKEKDDPPPLPYNNKGGTCIWKRRPTPLSMLHPPKGTYGLFGPGPKKRKETAKKQTHRLEIFLKNDQYLFYTITENPINYFIKKNNFHSVTRISGGKKFITHFANQAILVISHSFLIQLSSNLSCYLILPWFRNQTTKNQIKPN